LAVAGSTRGDDVLPYRLAAPAPGDDVVDGQARLAGTAVLTGPAVAGEHSLAGDPAAVDVARDADEGDQADLLGPVDPHRLGAKHAFAGFEHLCLLLQDQDQRPSNGAHVERLIARVQHQHAPSGQPANRCCRYLTLRIGLMGWVMAIRYGGPGVSVAVAARRGRAIAPRPPPPAPGGAPA